MELIIQEAVPSNKTPNSYEVVIKTMRGDADGYDYIIMEPFIRNQDEASIEFLLEVLTELAAAYTHGMGGMDNYSHVKHFETWFGGSSYDTEESYLKYAQNTLPYAEYAAAILVVGEHYADWPAEEGYQNSYEGFKIFYYDDNAVQHNVQVIQ